MTLNPLAQHALRLASQSEIARDPVQGRTTGDNQGLDQYVSLNDFIGQGPWTAYMVKPYDQANANEPLHELLGMDVNDEIRIRATSINSGPGPSASRTSDVLEVINTTRDGDSPLWNVDFDAALAELHGIASLPVRRDAVAAMRDTFRELLDEKNSAPSRRATRIIEEALVAGSIRDPHVLTIKYMGNLTQSMIDEAVLDFAKTGKNDDEAERLRNDLLKARKNGAKSLSFTWNNRFKHPGGYAHVQH